MHIKRIKQQMRLMPHSLPQTLKLSPIEIILQNRPIRLMRTALDDLACPLPRTHAPDIREPHLRHDDIEVVLRLVDVRAHGHDAGDAVGVGFRGAGRRRVHDAVLGGAEEVGGAAEAVEHARPHDAGAVGVGVDVDFDGGVHADDAEAADDLGGVGDLLRAQEELRVVVLPAGVEALEAVGREADRGRGCEIEVVAVEQIQK